MIKKTLKYLFLLLLIIVSNISHSQKNVKTIRIELRNSIDENIENATIIIDSVEIKYDTLTKTYFSIGNFNPYFDVKITCEGYENFSYNRRDIPYSTYYSTDFVARLHISKQGDKYYYYTPHFKVPYRPHSDELLVILKTKESIISEKSISEFENFIQKYDLIVYKTFLELPPQNTLEYMEYMSVSPSIRKKIILKKKDNSNFHADSCAELTFLRQLEQVESAGPIIMRNNSYYDAFTFNHFINLDYPLKSIDGAALDKLLKGIDERYFFDEKNYRIVLPPETNENVPQIMEKIYESGVTEKLYMSVFGVVKTNAAIDSKLKNDNPIEYGRFVRGGEEIQYDKEWNKIGIVFEAGFTDHLPFLTKFNLEKDHQYSNRNFTVFRLTESLPLEKRKRLMESIKEEKYVKVVGDILSGSIISEQIIVRWNRPTTDSEEINKFLKEEGLEISQQTTMNGTILNVSNPFNYRVIEVCNKLMNSGLVTFAEPDLYFQTTY